MAAADGRITQLMMAVRSSHATIPTPLNWRPDQVVDLGFVSR